MKIIWLTRIRNEENIIENTLDHMATFCTWWVYIYDDFSTDSTWEIIEKHHIVKKVIKWKKWDNNREKAEFENRQELLLLAKRYANNNDWFIYMDADERVEFNWSSLENINKNIIWIRMRLFDFYITKFDIDQNFNKRKYIGPEYRDILMLFKNTNSLKYHNPDQREVYIWHKWIVSRLWYVKHYWKAISIKQWEETCEYYSTQFPKYAKKWENRKWKAVHTISDFWFPLITWKEKENKWVPLWKIEIKSSNILSRSIVYTIKYLRILKETIVNLFYKFI